MSVFQIPDRKFEITNPGSDRAAHPKPGGGEGIRTPDPRVANAVLCQLSYTPDKANLKFKIPNSREVGCGGGI